jgi:hypothetical protein
METEVMEGYTIGVDGRGRERSSHDRDSQNFQRKDSDKSIEREKKRDAEWMSNKKCPMDDQSAPA